MAFKIKLPPEQLALFQKAGSIGGKKAAANMTPESRAARAKKAVATREAKREQRRRVEAVA
jgi:hypothetical protein